MQISAKRFQLNVIRLENLPQKKADRIGYYRLETQKFLEQSLGVTEQIVRTSSGTPTLSSKKLSISHSNDFLALMVSDSRCGIDIQIQNRSLNRGKDWFYNESEQLIFGEDPTEDLLYLIWCVKEALYKLFEGKIDDLKNDVQIVGMQTDKAIASYGGQLFEVQIRKTADYFLAYCVESHSD